MEKGLSTIGNDDRALDRASGLLRMRSFNEAEAVLRIRLQSLPDDVSSLRLLGTCLLQAGRVDDALTPLRRVVELLGSSPGSATARYELAGALSLARRHAEAADRLKEALALRPEFPEAWLALGLALQRCGSAEAAIGAIDRALELRPGFAEAHDARGITLESLGEMHSAIGCYARAVELREDFAVALRHLASGLADTGDLAGAAAAYRRSLRIARSAEVHSDLIVAMQYDDRQTHEALLSEARTWAQRYADRSPRRTDEFSNDPDPDRRVRIGYLSPDLRDHPLGRLLESVLAAHDRRAVEVFCYNDSAGAPSSADTVARRIREHSHNWRDTGAMTHQSLADLIRRDAIDILVECAGHFRNNRLTMMTARAAPVQASLCYPATTGVPQIDYRFTDETSDPPGVADRWYCEKLVRLPSCSTCYAPPALSPDPERLPAGSRGRITFGNLNNPIKTTDVVVATWARILHRVKHSRLAMLCKRGGDGYLMARFARHGVHPNRLEFVRPSPREAYLGKYREIDICLDPFPFNGDTTTWDALWMGVPVITMVGDRFVSRRGLSFLVNVGLAGRNDGTSLAAHSPDEYVESAVALADDLPRLSSLRSELRPRLLASPLTDTVAYARNLESAYRQMWRGWCQKNRG